MLILASSPPLTGCASFLLRSPITLCPSDPRISDPTTPLTVDTHGHVFNASGLQIRGFIDHALTKGVTGGISSASDPRGKTEGRSPLQDVKNGSRTGAASASDWMNKIDDAARQRVA
jgi:hypothetical protein